MSTYACGQYFADKPGQEIGTYILVQSDYYKCCIINVVGGNRYKDPITVKDPDKVSEAELAAMITYKLYPCAGLIPKKRKSISLSKVKEILAKEVRCSPENVEVDYSGAFTVPYNATI